MRNWIEKFRQNGLLKEINESLDIDQEIAVLSYIEAKKDDSKVLLFNNPTNKYGEKFCPILTNLFANKSALNLIFGCEVEQIADEISKLLKPEIPESFLQKIDFFYHLSKYRKIFPKYQKISGICQEVRQDEVDLFKLPILKTWPKDAGQFITMGQVYTKELSGKTQNLGMYRLQVFDKNHLGVHWQIHKDAMSIFYQYVKMGEKMPVSIAIGGDPLYIWCAQAPLPKGIFELLLYGFIRKNPAFLVKSLTNDIYIPQDVDFVIEGFVDTQNFKDEGPFGDHTGFYTPVEKFPVIEVTAITSKQNPIFNATVVGKPPIEDKFMGYATERIFLPLFKVNCPELIDYKMPENGVFHNLILSKIKTPYPFTARQIMHTFWGVGQMSFVKHAIFIDEFGPKLDDYLKFSEYVLDRFGKKSLIISEGICDQLDHASPNSCFGGKLCIDATADFCDFVPEILDDKKLFDLLNSAEPKIKNLKQYATNTKTPIVIVNFKKENKVKFSFRKILNFKEFFKVIIFVDENVNLNNPYMLIWRIVNNIDAKRDIFIEENQICLDATAKHEWEGYEREWPSEVFCDEKIVKKLSDMSLIKEKSNFFEKFEIICDK